MTEKLTFASYPIFTYVGSEDFISDREVAIKEAEELFASYEDRVKTRGVYSLAGFRASADIMFWWVSESADDLQDLLVEFRRTRLGTALVQDEQFLGLVRSAEFSPDHQPAFVQGKTPKKYCCVYPFVRTPEWYLLDPKDRGALLREHGGAGREFDDVWANTTSAFGLGDFEWILAFEADSLDRIVGLIRHLRGTEARRFTKVEIPFYTGIKKDLAGVVGDLP